jgi:phosphatidylinositol glycan class W
MSTDPPRRFHDKEAFVTGHSGTTSLEILFLCLVVPVGLHLYYKLLPLLRSNKHSYGQVALEFGTLLVPMLLVQTSLLPYVSGHVMLLLGMLLVASLVPKQKHRTQSTIKDDAKRPTFLSIHRASVYILTTIAILAVDFPLFPRRYCKTETSGYGWMDLGAASFVIIAGLTSSLSSGVAKCAKSSSSYKAMKKCAPLLLLGVIRLATNKGLEYQEHVSEYGVYWNFFFTLCFVEGFMVVWKRMKFALGCTNVPVDGVSALVMIVQYQIFLCLGGQDFIENGDRRCTKDPTVSWPMCDVYYANREGILGLFGYVGIRLLSEEIGGFCFLPKQQLSEMDKSVGMAELRQQRLLLTTLLLWVIHVVLICGLQIPTSRRSTNASFIFWALAHNMTILCSIRFVSEASTHKNDTKPAIPRLLDAVNRYGLAVFLLSNILTGLVNLTVDTLHASDVKAMVVLSLYLGLVCGSALLLDKLFNGKPEKLD